jgi:hypothetical protein
MKTYARNFILLLSLVFLANCGATLTSKGKYGPTVPSDKVSGSYVQAKRTFIVNFDANDTRAAAIKAFGLEGMSFEVDRGNMMSGAGTWASRDTSCKCTYAIYIEQIDNSPKTRITFVADYQTWIGSGLFGPTSAPSKFISQVAKHFNTIIASYEQ